MQNLEKQNTSSESNVSNCPICYEPLKKKHAREFICKSHAGHSDCIDRFYLSQEDSLTCPFRCV